MQNFSFYNPVKIIFGQGTISKLSKELPQSSKIMLIYGSGSIKKNGVYQQVYDVLKDFVTVEFSGIEPNPHFETCMKCVEKIKAENVDFLLAVGGGSVIDATKFIAAAAKFNGDAWKIMTGEGRVNEALPFGTVLTLPATASEMNKGAVITKAETREKLAFHSEKVYPKFSILDPETTYTLPKIQIANGIIDTFVHVTEQYLTTNENAKIQDYFAESILKVLIEESKIVFENPTDYDCRANLMWAATWGLNGWIGQGNIEDWATHIIGHELTAFHEIDHGQTLAIVLPGVMKIMQGEKREKILQMGKNVFGIKEIDEDKIINLTINAVDEFFQSLGIKTHLNDYNVGNETITKIVERFKEREWLLGEHENIDSEIVEIILKDRI